MNGIGERLRQKREELGLSVEQAAEATKFRPELIRAVEEGRAGLFSASAHRNGFVRTYAKVLGLDGDELVRSQKSEEERAQEALRGIGPRPTGGPKLSRIAVILIAVAVVAVIASVVVNLAGRSEPSPGDDNGAAQPATRQEKAGRDGGQATGGSSAGEAGGAAGSRAVGSAPDMDYIPSSKATAPGVGGAAGGAVGDLPGRGVVPGGRVEAGSSVGEPVAGLPAGTLQGADAAGDSVRIRALEVAAERHSVFLILKDGERDVYDGWIYRGTRKVFRGSGEFVIVSLSSSEGVSVTLDGRPIVLPEPQAEDKSLADWPIAPGP
ncbi:MAG: helix-turn-helix domain-containing protein [bacterium]